MIECTKNPCPIPFLLSFSLQLSQSLQLLVLVNNHQRTRLLFFFFFFFDYLHILSFFSVGLAFQPKCCSIFLPHSQFLEIFFCLFLQTCFIFSPSFSFECIAVNSESVCVCAKRTSNTHISTLFLLEHPKNTKQQKKRFPTSVIWSPMGGLKFGQSSRFETMSDILYQARHSLIGKLDRRVRSSRFFTFTIVFATLYAVFADDIRIMVAPKSSDPIIFAFFYVCFAIFSFDIALSCLFDKAYPKSALIVLDVIATGSLLITPLMANSSHSDTQGLALARIARIIRLMRIVRVARIARVAKDVALNKAAEKRIAAQINAAEVADNASMVSGSVRAASASVASVAAASSAMASQNRNTRTDMSGHLSVPQSGRGLMGAVSDNVTRRTSLLGTSWFRDPSRDRNDPSANKSTANAPTTIGIGEDEPPPMIELEIIKSSNPEPEPFPIKGEPTKTWSVNSASINTGSSAMGSANARSMIGTTLLQRTTQNIIFLVLTLAIGFELLILIVPNNTEKSDLRLLHDMYDSFDNGSCFVGVDAQTREMCTVTPCCATWNDVLLSVQSSSSQPHSRSNLRSATKYFQLFVHYFIHLVINISICFDLFVFFFSLFSFLAKNFFLADMQKSRAWYSLMSPCPRSEHRRKSMFHSTILVSFSTFQPTTSWLQRGALDRQCL
jgi:hypothetical protein